MDAWYADYSKAAMRTERKVFGFGDLLFDYIKSHRFGREEFDGCRIQMGVPRIPKWLLNNAEFALSYEPDMYEAALLEYSVVGGYTYSLIRKKEAINGFISKQNVTPLNEGFKVIALLHYDGTSSDWDGMYIKYDLHQGFTGEVRDGSDVYKADMKKISEYYDIVY